MVLKSFAARYFSNATLETLFLWVWYAVLVFRFLVPVYDSPMGHLFSDPARHWLNGQRLLTPDIMGSIDPKLYQLYVWLISALSMGKPEAIAVFTGLLSVTMAWVWYQACRELFLPLQARIMGCLIGITPSFTALYTLFMNETLMLVLMGAGVWCSLRAARTQQFRWAVAAALCWVLASYTRTLMIPLAAGFLWYVAYHLPRYRWRLVAGTLLLTLALAIPAGWHSWQKLRVVAPFGFPDMNAFYFYTGAQVFEIDTEQGRYGFSSPIFHYPIGMPFFEYESCRLKKTAVAKIDTQAGRRDWDAAIAQAQANYGWDKLWCGLKENFIFLVAGNSWPDSAVQWGYQWIYYLNFHLRWMWLPMMLVLLIRTPMVRLPAPQQLILASALGLLFLLLFQMMVMNEGRYRKPLEVLLMLAMGIFWRESRRNTTTKGVSQLHLWQFLWQYYLLPVRHFFRNTCNMYRKIVQ